MKPEDNKKQSTGKKRYKDLTIEEKLEAIKNLSLTNDRFFGLVMSRKEACQELIDTVLEEKFIVDSVIEQHDYKNDDYHGIRIDVHAADQEDRNAIIEMQVANNDDHLKRVRYYRGTVDTHSLDPGEKYTKLKDIYIIFITVKDFIGGGSGFYKVRKSAVANAGDNEMEFFLDDGAYEYYVNLEKEDNTPQRIVDLARFIKNPNTYNAKFQRISNVIKNLQESKKGKDDMCEITDWIYNEGREEGEEAEKILNRKLHEELKRRGRLDEFTDAVLNDDKKKSLCLEFGIDYE